MRMRRWNFGSSGPRGCVTNGRRVFGDGARTGETTCCTSCGWMFSLASRGGDGAATGERTGERAGERSSVSIVGNARDALSVDGGDASARRRCAGDEGATAAAAAVLTSAPCDAAAATALAARRPHASSRCSFSTCARKSSTSWRASKTARRSVCAERGHEKETGRGRNEEVGEWTSAAGPH